MTGATGEGGNSFTRGSTVFIADLHLDPAAPARLHAFRAFLDELAAARPEALYILGDLFEVWSGRACLDDDRYLPVIDGLRRLSGEGVPVTVLKGNRDFQIG